MTQEEAKTKWCPMVRTGLVAGMAVNHHAGSRLDAPPQGGVHDETRCVASACMMWRWDSLPASGSVVHAAYEPKGYCGLAGAPQHAQQLVAQSQQEKLHKAKAVKNG